MRHHKPSPGGGKAPSPRRAPRRGWLLGELALGLAVAGLWLGLALAEGLGAAAARARARRERTAYLLARGIAAELALGLGKTETMRPKAYLAMRSGARDVRRVGLGPAELRLLADLEVGIEVRGPAVRVETKARGVRFRQPEDP